MTINDYVAQIRKWFVWTSVETACKESAQSRLADRETPDDADTYEGAYRLGSCLYLCPSGKYYTVWSDNNVSPCPFCRGSGRMTPPFLCTVCRGTGKHSVTVVADVRGESGPAALSSIVLELGRQGVKVDDSLHYPCAACGGTGTAGAVCESCDGAGSIEVNEDLKWLAALDIVAGEYGMTSRRGEDDPCDVWVSRWYTAKELADVN